jgi:branched-subunit amino acid ABC-type transport system permease component
MAIISAPSGVSDAIAFILLISVLAIKPTGLFSAGVSR